MSDLSVSVIVTSHGQPEVLRRALEGLKDQGFANLDVIVVEERASDAAAGVVASFRDARLIEAETAGGVTEARNRACDCVTGKYVALLDAEVVLGQRWLLSLIEFLERTPGAAAAAGKLFFWNEKNPLLDRSNHHFGHIIVDPASAVSEMVIDGYDGVCEVASLPGSAMLLRRSAIRVMAAPLFEPFHFPRFEDLDLFARMLERGWQLYYLPGAEAWKPVAEGDCRNLGFFEPAAYRDRLKFIFRNYRAGSLVRFLRGELCSAAGQLFVAIRSSSLRRKGLTRRVRPVLYLLLSLPRLFKERRRVTQRSAGYNERVRWLQVTPGYFRCSRPEVAALVPESVKFVVDVGCGAGELGRSLKESRPGIEVRGVEALTAAAELAREVLDDVLAGGADDAMPEDWPDPDCVIFSDVLEHLPDPASVLRAWRLRLASRGLIVVSIPNVGYWSVVQGLLVGRWDYHAAGVLDRTHLRFFTRKTGVQLLEVAGFEVIKVSRVVDVPDYAPCGRWLKWAGAKHGDILADGSPAGGVGLGSYCADLATLQYLIVARPRAG